MLGFALVLLVFVVLASAVTSANAGFSPGEEVYAPGVESVVASAGDAGSAGSDASRFGRRTREVRVDLRVEDLPRPARFAATVERSGRSSVLSRLFGSDEVAVSDGRGERLAVSEGGVSGVVGFAVRARDGGALPSGEYTVGVRVEGEGPGGIVARKYFVVGGR